MMTDRRSHFRSLRTKVLAWQRDEIDSPPESWAAFTARVEAARQFLTKDRSGPILAVSSGSAISQMINATLGAAPEQQISLQLQMKNCAVTHFIYSPRAFYLQSFNETPHITDAASRPLLNYS